MWAKQQLFDPNNKSLEKKILETNNPKDRIKKTELGQEFKLWFQREQGTRKIPKGQELYDYMDKKFGQCHKTTGWSSVKIMYPKEDADEMSEL